MNPRFENALYKTGLALAIGGNFYAFYEKESRENEALQNRPPIVIEWEANLQRLNKAKALVECSLLGSFAAQDSVFDHSTLDLAILNYNSTIDLQKRLFEQNRETIRQHYSNHRANKMFEDFRVTGLGFAFATTAMLLQWSREKREKKRVSTNNF